MTHKRYYYATEQFRSKIYVDNKDGYTLVTCPDSAYTLICSPNLESMKRLRTYVSRRSINYHAEYEKMREKLSREIGKIRTSEVEKFKSSFVSYDKERLCLTLYTQPTNVEALVYLARKGSVKCIQILDVIRYTIEVVKENLASCLTPDFTKIMIDIFLKYFNTTTLE